MQTSARILLLEDDPNLGAVTSDHLGMHGFEVVLCANGEEGMKQFQSDIFDLCLVDVMMPKKDGFAFAREVRRVTQQVPLIFLTARSLKEDRIEGFRIGCDDYVTKPFAIEELILRIQAILRRTKQAATNSTPAASIRIGKYDFDHTRLELTNDGDTRHLTGREADLLLLLVRHMNDVVERETILIELWREHTYYTSRSLDVFITRLRKYFVDDDTIRIVAVHGRGYRLSVS
jgi:DNA-binding response OmpR family regulator